MLASQLFIAYVPDYVISYAITYTNCIIRSILLLPDVLRLTHNALLL